HTIESVYF
ncbi:CPXV054 protein, partial [Monkeypox virus]